jgi:hypothetical protein
MAFTYTEIHRVADANLIIAYGTYTSTENDEGGEITVLDLHSILNVSLQPVGTTVETDAPVVNEEFTGLPVRINKNSFAIKTVANGCGLWKVEGT